MSSGNPPARVAPTRGRPTSVGPRDRPTSVGHGIHLARRFFTSLSARQPDADDLRWARSQLSDAEWALWQQMGVRDQRHSIQVARGYVGRRPAATAAEVAGALLHDVGKVAGGLGTFARVVARLAGPRTRRLREYHEHETIGAEMAAAAGCSPVTVALVRGVARDEETARAPELPAMISTLRDADDAT